MNIDVYIYIIVFIFRCNIKYSLKFFSFVKMGRNKEGSDNNTPTEILMQCEFSSECNRGVGLSSFHKQLIN